MSKMPTKTRPKEGIGAFGVSERATYMNECRKMLGGVKETSRNGEPDRRAPATRYLCMTEASKQDDLTDGDTEGRDVDPNRGTGRGLGGLQTPELKRSYCTYELGVSFTLTPPS